MNGVDDVAQSKPSRRNFLKLAAVTAASNMVLYGYASPACSEQMIMGGRQDNHSLQALSETELLSLNTINWDDGRLIKIAPGETATCSTLKKGQLYAIFLRNISQHDHDVNAIVTWRNSEIPVTVIVHGSSDNRGATSTVLVSGNDTTTISIAITHISGGVVECCIGSVEMPHNSSGINNHYLHGNGLILPFTKGNRFYTTPSNGWQKVTIKNTLNQNIVTQFRRHQIIIYIINSTTNPVVGITPIGSVTVNRDYQIIRPPEDQPPQYISLTFQGDNNEWVWMNFDSSENARHTSISLQALVRKLMPKQGKLLVAPSLISK